MIVYDTSFGAFCPRQTDLAEGFPVDGIATRAEVAWEQSEIQRGHP